MSGADTAEDREPADVVVVGSLNVDLVYTLDHRPPPGETVLGNTLAHHPGGKGANQAAAAARAGGHVLMVGAVGDDQYGRGYLRGLRAQGVDTSGVAVIDGQHTGVAIIGVTPDGENSIVVIAGANAHLGADHLPSPTQIRRGGVVLCQLEVPLGTVVAASRVAGEAGARFVLNPSPVRTVPPELLRACDPVVVNVHEARHLLEADAAGGVDLDEADVGRCLARTLLERGPRSVVVTLGAGGAIWIGRHDRTGGGPVHVAAPSVEVVDTTGAGDAFAGTLASALALTGDGPAALRAAVAAGSEACTWHGAQPWQLEAARER